MDGEHLEIRQGTDRDLNEMLGQSFKSVGGPKSVRSNATMGVQASVVDLEITPYDPIP